MKKTTPARAFLYKGKDLGDATEYKFGHVDAEEQAQVSHALVVSKSEESSEPVVPVGRADEAEKPNAGADSTARAVPQATDEPSTATTVSSSNAPCSQSLC